MFDRQQISRAPLAVSLADILFLCLAPVGNKVSKVGEGGCVCLLPVGAAPRQAAVALAQVCITYRTL